MTHLALATRSAGFEQRVRRAFGGQLNGELRRWRGVVAGQDLRAVALDLGQDDPSVVAFGPDVPLDMALAVARELDESRPEISVVVVTEPAPEMWEEALRAGVRDLVPTTASDDELRKALERAVNTSNRRRRNLVQDAAGSGTGGRVITVVAPKGGSGKTAIATNLGVGLARAVPGQVALVDLDLQFGDITVVLDLAPEHTIADALKADGKVDATALKVFLTKRPGDLYVLAAPQVPEEGEQVSEGLVHRAVGLLAEEFPYVVVDTAAGLTEQTLAVLELSTDLVLVCDLSASAARGMRKVLDALDRLGMTTQTRHFVVNRADSKVGLELAEVAALVGMPVDVKLPSSRAVAYSMNEGVPLVESAPRAAFARRIADMVTRFVPEHAPSGRRLLARRSIGS